MFAMHSAAFACFLLVCTRALCVLQVLHAENRQTMKKGRRIFLSWKKSRGFFVVDVSVETIEVSSTGLDIAWRKTHEMTALTTTWWI